MTVTPSAVVVNTRDGAVVIAAPGFTSEVFWAVNVKVTGCPGMPKLGPVLVTTTPGLNNSTTLTSEASVCENCWPLGGTYTAKATFVIGLVLTNAPAGTV